MTLPHDGISKKGARLPDLVDISFAPPEVTHPAFTDRSPTSLHTFVNRFAGQALAVNTDASYVSKVRLFADFCRQHFLLVSPTGPSTTSWPRLTLPVVTPLLLSFYIAFLYRRGHDTFDSISAYVTALVTWCKVNNRPNPRNHPDLGIPDHTLFCVLRGLKREMGTPQPTRYPMTLFHIDALIWAATRLLVVKLAANFIAAILLAFSALLRVSEFTVKGQFNPIMHATRGDIKFEPSMLNPHTVHFTIKKSKTDQFGEGMTISLPRNDNQQRCPVAALLALYTTDPQPPSAPLLNFSADNSRQNSSRLAFATLCNKLFSYCGIKSMYLKPHSFRQGGATALLAAGAPEWVIKVIGRWRSDCWQAYSFTDQRTLAKWSLRMLQEAACPVDYDVNPPLRIMDY